MQPREFKNQEPHQRKAARFTESVIREMTREALRHNAINLAQGFRIFLRLRN